MSWTIDPQFSPDPSTVFLRAQHPRLGVLIDESTADVRKMIQAAVESEMVAVAPPGNAAHVLDELARTRQRLALAQAQRDELQAKKRVLELSTEADLGKKLTVVNREIEAAEAEVTDAEGAVRSLEPLAMQHQQEQHAFRQAIASVGHRRVKEELIADQGAALQQISQQAGEPLTKYLKATAALARYDFIAGSELERLLGPR
jgi:hypothetical protein